MNWQAKVTDDSQPETEISGAPQSESAEAERLRTSPGHLMRSARERQDMSLDDLTERTLLNRTTVEALENNQFDRLSQPVFVRGYYRKCAKVLDIPEDELLEAYANWAGESGPRPASPGQVDVVPQDVTPQRWRALGMILVVGLLLVAIGMAWVWLPQLISGATGEMNSPESSISTGTTVPPTSTSGESGNTGTTSSESSEGGSSLINTSAASGDSGDESAQADAEPASGAAGSADAGNGGNAGSVAAVDGQTAAGADDSETTESGGSAAGGDGKLVLRFGERSWVRVRDAGGTVLLDGIVDGGNLRVVEGQPPYDVALGYAPGVEVAIGGRSVDLSNRIDDDDTARFTVRTDGE